MRYVSGSRNVPKAWHNLTPMTRDEMEEAMESHPGYFINRAGYMCDRIRLLGGGYEIITVARPKEITVMQVKRFMTDLQRADVGTLTPVQIAFRKAQEEVRDNR